MFMLMACTLFAEPARAAIDISTLVKASGEQVAVSASYKSYNRVTKESSYEVAATTISANGVKGPAYLVLESLSGNGVTAKNAVGTTTDGRPYYLLKNDNLTPSEKLTVSVVLGNPANVRVNFTSAVYVTPTPLTVVITNPATLITVGSTPLTIEGTVSDPDANLTVNGVPVTNNNGAFKADVALTEGHNSIVARAVKGTQEGTGTISVSLDLTPPYITIESPLNGATVTSKVVAVSGLINDIVRGTVSEGQANVTVNGKARSRNSGG